MGLLYFLPIHRGVDKSLARPRRTQANVSVRTFAGAGGLDDSSRLDVLEVARVPDMLPSLFPSWSG